MDDTIPAYISKPKNGQHRSVTRHYGGRITIWRGGSVYEHWVTLASYRRIRRWMQAEGRQP